MVAFSVIVGFWLRGGGPPRSTVTDTLVPYRTLFRCGDSGVGEQDVDPAEGFGHVGDGRFGGGDVGGVGLHGNGVRAELLQRGIQRGPVAAGDGDPRPLGDEGFRGGKANAAVAAGDQRRLVLQSHDTLLLRSEARRVGKECVSTLRYRWSP